MRYLENLEPKSVFMFFEEICGIPHGSGHTQALSDYCQEFARKRGLSCIQDEMGNVVIQKPAAPGYEKADTVILQGHLDMVLEQLPGNTRDLKTQGLLLGVDGDWVHANGTTLGGDDGIAVAYMLALLDNDYAHPSLECVFTVDEETGLLGADALDASVLKGTRMINLDSEEEGIFTVGCAGGLTGIGTLPVGWIPGQGTLVTLTVEGLQGGHSGVEIQKQRGNAIKLLGRLLGRLDRYFSFTVVSMEGGRVENAIPNQASVKIAVDPGEAEMLCQEVSSCEEDFRHEFRASDPQVRISLEKGDSYEGKVLDPRSLALVLFLLQMIPSGVDRYSMEIPGLVETSSNLGVIRLTEEQFQVYHSVRSSIDSQKEYVSDQVRLLLEFFGGEYETQGVYPGWEFQKDSKLLQVMKDQYKSLYKKEPTVEAIHAGLECGIFCSRIEGLECVSIGPSMRDIHSGKERLSISSVKRVWEFLLAVLEQL